MSKIVKKADLDVLIESTLKKAGIKIIKEDNIGDYYLSSGNTNKWFDKNDSSYDMQGEDWEEVSYDNFEDWSNSPYGQDTEYKGTFNPRVRDSEKWFNRYRDVNGPVKVRRARMTPSNAPMIQGGLGESTKTKKPLINEDFKKELEKFNKLTKRKAQK